MLTSESCKWLRLLLILVCMQYGGIHGRMMWIEQTFSSDPEGDDYIKLPYDNLTGCRIFRYPDSRYYSVYGTYCTALPTNLVPTPRKLAIRTSAICVIHSDFFKAMPDLVFLKIDMNRGLVEIESNAFSSLTKLTQLTISNNYLLKPLNPDVFNGLVSLKELIYFKNNAMNLPRFVKSVKPSVLPSLISLDISQNIFEKINEIDFTPMKGSKLEILKMNYCKISEMDDNCLSPLTKLQTLYLDGNNLNAQKLSLLLLSLRNTALNFNEISLAENLLNDAQPTLFKSIALTNITNLNIEKNHFDILKNDSFPIIPSLIKLDLSSVQIENFVEIINNDTLPNLSSLIICNVGLNSFVPSLLLPNLIELDVSDNNCRNCDAPTLFTIKDNVFKNVSNLKILNLSKNVLYQIKVDYFFGLMNLESLHLSNCSLMLIEDYSFSNLTKLIDLDLSYNKFRLNTSLKAATFYGLTSLVVLKLHYSKITSFQDTNIFSSLPNLKYITMRGNNMVDIDPALFTPVPRLLEVDLSENGMDVWTTRLFSNNSDLQAVSLIQNRLTRFSKAMLNDFINLKYLDLRNNEWHCSCATVLVVQQYLSNMNLSMDALPLQDPRDLCYSPKDTATLPLKQYLKTQIENDLCLSLKLDIILITTFSFVLLTMLCALLAYYYRWHIRYWIFLLRQAVRHNYFPGLKKTNSIVADKYKYDAFVSYSHEDRNFVVRLVSMLETQNPFFTLCVFERDFSVGDVITDSVLECLSCSRRTILVLSDSFARSTWCLWEMQLAQHKRLFFKDEQIEPLVIIKIGEIMDRHMTPTLRYLIKSRVYLQWNPDPRKQKIFWQKLREALTPPKVHV